MTKIKLQSNLKVGQELQGGVVLSEEMFKQTERLIASSDVVLLFSDTSNCLSEAVGRFISAELVDGRLLYEVSVMDTPMGRMLLDMLHAGKQARVVTTWMVDYNSDALPTVKNFSVTYEP